MRSFAPRTLPGKVSLGLLLASFLSLIWLLASLAFGDWPAVVYRSPDTGGVVEQGPLWLPYFYTLLFGSLTLVTGLRLLLEGRIEEGQASGEDTSYTGGMLASYGALAVWLVATYAFFVNVVETFLRRSGYAVADLASGPPTLMIALGLIASIVLSLVLAGRRPVGSSERRVASILRSGLVVGMLVAEAGLVAGAFLSELLHRLIWMRSGLYMGYKFDRPIDERLVLYVFAVCAAGILIGALGGLVGSLPAAVRQVAGRGPATRRPA